MSILILSLLIMGVFIIFHFIRITLDSIKINIHILYFISSSKPLIISIIHCQFFFISREGQKFRFVRAVMFVIIKKRELNVFLIIEVNFLFMIIVVLNFLPIFLSHELIGFSIWRTFCRIENTLSKKLLLGFF